MSGHLTRVRTSVRIHAHRRVRGQLEGEYAALDPGRSTDFNDLREYVRGDDVKDLDWKASARTRTMLVRRYTANRKLLVSLVVPTGRSMAAANDLDVPKRDLAVTVVGVMGHLAVGHGDRVCLVLGDADRQAHRPSTGGELGLERCLAAVHDAIGPDAGSTDLAAVLRHAARVVRTRTVMLVVCDAPVLEDDAVAALRRLRVQHEVLLVTVGDLDPSVVRTGRALRDVDSGQGLPAWLREDTRLGLELLDRTRADAERLAGQLRSTGVVHEHVAGHADAVPALLRLLERHRRARRR
ncbi:DUF58 domain-containing protein [Nocardioides sp. NPDC092400]|uniref:DUF58 domain-containing protein n=1 Tax=Nocardioides sp. NPDC092400 TaxID=3155196 RepID=UPI0034243075